MLSMIISSKFFYMVDIALQKIQHFPKDITFAITHSVAVTKQANDL